MRFFFLGLGLSGGSGLTRASHQKVFVLGIKI